MWDDETTIVAMLARRFEEGGDSCALHRKQHGQFATISWNELADQVWRVAAVLAGAGAAPGVPVVQFAENRFEWVVCDLAMQWLGAVHVPLHAPLTGEQAIWQIADSEARLMIVAGDEQLEKLEPFQARLPAGSRLFSFDETTRSLPGLEITRLTSDTDRLDDSSVSEVAGWSPDRVAHDALATILYTSGTTGEPKGVMLTQRNLATNTLATVSAFGQDASDIRLSFLPFSHIFARTCDLYTWIAQGCQLAIAESRETVVADCALIRPTLLNGVPYFFEKVSRYLVEQGHAETPGALAQILGGRIRLCCSGGAALPDHVFDFFTAQNVSLLQGYGLTETSPVITLTPEGQARRGSVGRAIDGIDVRIADDGEILTRGPHVMVGYYKNRKATSEMIRDGWLVTGDLGRMDEDGFLFITGRKKEILVTLGGKNVAPVYLESLLTEDPWIEQAMVVGDGRKFLAALVVPAQPAMVADAASRGIAEPFSELVKRPEILAEMEARLRARLAGVSHYEQVQRFCLINEPFSIDAGQLTPKLSLRRPVISDQYAAEIEAMYRD